MLALMFTDTDYQLRKATQNEIPDILSIAKATWEPTYREILSKAQIDYMYDEIYAPSALEKQMFELGHVFLVLYASDVAVAYASYGPKNGTHEVYKVHKLYVHPDYQGQKYGRILIQAIEKETKGLGASVLELNVNRYNPAIRFYERCGYQQAREEDIPMGEFWMNDFVMRKELR